MNMRMVPYLGAAILSALVACSSMTPPVDAHHDSFSQCRPGDSGYLDAYFVDDTHQKVYTTLHRHFPPTMENMTCIIYNQQRITIEPEEKSL